MAAKVVSRAPAGAEIALTSDVARTLGNTERRIMLDADRVIFIHKAIGMVEREDYLAGAKSEDERYRAHARTIELFEGLMRDRSSLKVIEKVGGAVDVTCAYCGEVLLKEKPAFWNGVTGDDAKLYHFSKPILLPDSAARTLEENVRRDQDKKREPQAQPAIDEKEMKRLRDEGLISPEMEARMRERLNQPAQRQEPEQQLIVKPDQLVVDIMGVIRLELTRMAEIAKKEGWQDKLNENVTRLIDNVTRYPPQGEIKPTKELVVDILLQFGFKNEAIERAKPIYNSKFNDGDLEGARRFADHVGMGSTYTDQVIKQLRIDHDALVARFQELANAAKPAMDEAKILEQKRLSTDKKYSDQELESLSRALGALKSALDFGKDKGLSDSEIIGAVAQAKIVARELYEGHRSRAKEHEGEPMFYEGTMKVKPAPNKKEKEVEVAIPSKEYIDATSHAMAAFHLAKDWNLPAQLLVNAEELIKKFEDLLRMQADAAGLTLQRDKNPNPNAVEPGRVYRFLTSDGRPGEEVTRLL